MPTLAFLLAALQARADDDVETLAEVQSLAAHPEHAAAMLEHVGEGGGEDGPGVVAKSDHRVRKSAQHAPHAMTVQGKEYRGGEFIPAEVMELATPEEKAKVDGGAGGGDTTKKEANTAGLDQIVKALMMDDPGVEKKVIDGPSGDVEAAVAYSVAENPDDDDMSDWLEVHHIGSSGDIPGAGSALLLKVVNEAIRRGTGVFFDALQGSVSYYERMGFDHHGQGQQGDLMGADAATLRSVRKKLMKKVTKGLKIRTVKN